MTRLLSYAGGLAMGVLLCPLGAYASETSKIVRYGLDGKIIEEASPVTVEKAEQKKPYQEERESLIPGKGLSLALSHFTWGAEAGSSLDLTSHDLSTFDVDAFLGYKSKFIKLAGIGAGIHRAFHTGTNFVPVYAVFRSSFRSKPSLFFLNLQGGYSFYSISHSRSHGDITASVGLGINLFQSSAAKSYVILSANYQHFNDHTVAETTLDSKSIYFARLCVGVNF